MTGKIKLMMAMAAATVLCALPQASYAAKGFSHLSYMGEYLEKHPTVVNVWKPWFKEIEQKFNGKLSFDYFGTNGLYPEAEAAQAVTDGRADFGCVFPTRYPGKFQLIGAAALPGMCPNAIVGSLVAEELIEKFPEIRSQMPKNTVHFTAWTSAAYQIHTIKPVKSLQELKGKKIIVWDAITLEIIKAFGANPLRLTAPDSYMALSKAMADGVCCPLAPLRSYKITEATKHHLIINAQVQVFMEEANKDLWDSLPDDMKTYLSECGGLNMSLKVGQSLEDGVKNDTAWMDKQGHEFYYLTDDERAPFIDALSGFVDAWKKSCTDTAPEKVEEILSFTRERAKFHTEQMRQGKYGDYKM